MKATATAQAKVKPRPAWITKNKVMLALYWLADRKGVVEASASEIAHATGLRLRAHHIDQWLLWFESDGDIRVLPSDPSVFRVCICHYDEGADLAKQLVPAKLKITKKSVGAGKPTATKPAKTSTPAIESNPSAHEGPRSSPQATQLNFNW